MKILITGATGYIGHKLTEEAISKGYKVHILVRDIHSKYTPDHPDIITFKGDVTDKESVITAMKGCEKVLHAAGITSFYSKDRSVFYKVNVEGTRNMLEAALKLGVKKFVFTSTGAVLGPSGKYPMTENDPRIIAFENDYEISKHWAEELVKEYCRKGLFAMIVAAPRVYGPGLFTTGNVFDRLLSKVFSMKMAFIPSKGEVVANYAFVDDVIEGHFLALEYGLAGEKYILGGENLSYNAFFHAVRQYAGKKIWLIRIPRSLLITWSFFHMIIHRMAGKQTNISPVIIKRLLQNRALSSDKAIRQLGYTITPFKTGINKTILHIKNSKNG
jgi:nucleoside-diphosphate-sugar epimerase